MTIPSRRQIAESTNTGKNDMKKDNFSSCVSKAADIQIELSGLESQTKLSATGFLAEALVTAGGTRSLLDQIEKKLKETNAPAIEAFLRKIEKEFREPHFPRPPNDISRVNKIGRVYGRDDLLAEIAGLNLTLAGVVALGAKRSTTKYKDRFGMIEDFNLHANNIADLQSELKSRYQDMQASVSGSDLVFDQSRLSVSERDSGLCHVCFRNYPKLRFGPDWPSRIVDEAIRARTTKMKKSGEKAAKRALETATA